LESEKQLAQAHVCNLAEHEAIKTSFEKAVAPSERGDCVTLANDQIPLSNDPANW
jgi:hypothetical protein